MSPVQKYWRISAAFISSLNFEAWPVVVCILSNPLTSITADFTIVTPFIVAAAELDEALQCHQQWVIDSHRSLAMCRAAQHSTAVRIVSVTTCHRMARPRPCSHRTHQPSATQGAPHLSSQNSRPDFPSGEYGSFL